MTSKVRDGRDILEDLFQALIQEPLIGIFLDFDQVRHLKNFLLSRVAHPYAFTGRHRTYSAFLH